MKKEKRTKKIEVAVLVVISIVLLSAIPTDANDVSTIQEAVNYAMIEVLPLEGISGMVINDSVTPNRIIVFVENEQSKSLVPSEIKGFKTDIEVTGRFKALGYNERVSVFPKQMSPLFRETKPRMEVIRPMVGGISVGSKTLFGSGPTGTLGVCVQYSEHTYEYMLSNAHVFAYNGLIPLQRGTPIIQPGSYDGGTSANKVGTLANYIRLRWFRFTNRADCAVARIDNGIDFLLDTELSDSDYNDYYSVDMDSDVVPNDQTQVRKSGRTTGETYGTVKYNSVISKVYYGAFVWAGFLDLIKVSPFSDAGDSGSVVDQNGDFVGLVFAGSSEYSLVCKAEYIDDLWEM